MKKLLMCLLIGLLLILETMSVMAESPSTIVVNWPTYDMGATFSDLSDGTEPPPHVIVYDADGNTYFVVPRPD